MKKILLILILGAVLYVPAVNAENARQSSLHDMHMMMRFMDHALCVALEGADMIMLGQMKQSEKLDRDAVVHGTIMVKDGKAMIKEMLEGRAMRELYQEGNFDKLLMDKVHKLGESMLAVIEQVENIHKDALKQASGNEK